MYPSFYKRIIALLIDIVITSLPIAFIAWRFKSTDNLIVALSISLFDIALVHFMRIYFVSKYATTPGNRLLKMKVVGINGSNLNFFQSFKRECLYLCIGFIQIIIIFMTIGSQPNLISISYVDLGVLLQKHKSVSEILTYFYFCIYFLNYVTIFFNNKKQSIADIIASCIVLKSEAQLSKSNC